MDKNNHPIWGAVGQPFWGTAGQMYISSSLLPQPFSFNNFSIIGGLEIQIGPSGIQGTGQYNFIDGAATWNVDPSLSLSPIDIGPTG